MRKKIAPIFLALFILLIGINGAAWGSTYFGYDTCLDVNKAGGPDSRMCWAAAASNILAWGHWGTVTDNTESKIFQNFIDHWTNAGSLMNYAWRWWLNGILPDAGSTSQVDVSGGGNYWPGGNFADKFQGDWTGDLMLTVDQYLHAGYGVSIAIYKPGGGHALTVWGFEAEDLGNGNKSYKSIRVTDSDDFYSGYVDYSLVWNSSESYYELTGRYDDWHIGEVQALDRNVPLPATIILFGSGLLGLVGLRRWCRH